MRARRSLKQIRFKFGVAVSISLTQFFAPNMPLKLAPLLRACCVVGALMVCHAIAADRKPSLVGATRAQVIARFGEPKSQIVAGDRQVLFFTGERVVLRNDLVIEADEIPVEAPPPAAAPSDQGSAAGGNTTGTSSTNTATPTGGAANAASSGVVSTATPPPPAPETQAQIISVRPPSKDLAPTPAPAPSPPAATAAPAGVSSSTATAPVATPSIKAVVPPAAAPAVPPTPMPSPAAVPATSTPATATVASTSEQAASAPAKSEGTASTVGNVAPDAAAAVSADATPATAPGATAPASVTPSTTRVPAKRAAKRPSNEPVELDVTAGMFTTQTYVIAAIIIIGGIGYLIWRRREQGLALEVTAVSRSPFAADAAPAQAGARFTADLLNKLEWKRFEELVASYYNKTGVVATRTKTGPASPVHIKISWKGETQPFASVQCLAHPPGLIDAKSIQALCEVLAAEDIRRGYVVTSGKFAVPARDLAEEKHIMLLSGDIFLEKLNALPDAARNELMRDASAGDYVTPTCPQCEAKMARSAEDSSVWQCPQCSTVLPRA